MRSARLSALRELQGAFDGAADEAGLETEEDVAALVREVHRDMAGR
ncbi:MAG: hypothetical protein IKG21_00090 [Atopobiaceae bacterium]|nr:hypothetical protein [Atopobiaceae bacterium]